MAVATEPQAHPIVSTDVTRTICELLDATLAAHDVIRPSFAVLPDAADYPLVDLAIRLWASVHPEVKLVEWGQWSSQPSGDDPGYWIEGYKLAVGWRDLCTVHTPDGLRTRQPAPIALEPAAPSNVVALPIAPVAEPDVLPLSNAEERRALGDGDGDGDDTSTRFSLLELD